MKKSKSYALLALLAGAVCFGLRRWQMAAEFDELGLPVPGRATWALALAAVVSAVGFALLVLPLRKSGAWSEVLGERPLLPLWGAFPLYALAAARMLWEQRMAPDHMGVFLVADRVIPILMTVGALAAALGVGLAAPGGERRGQNLVLPTLFGCFWTVSAYHSHGTDPVVAHFVWLLLMVACSALGWYELTGLSMNRGHGRRCLYLCLMTVVFGMTALAGEMGLAERLLTAAQILCFFYCSMALGEGLGKEAAEE